jgi:hypothetical protein
MAMQKFVDKNSVEILQHKCLASEKQAWSPDRNI